MDILRYFLIAGFVMALFSVPVIALFSILEANDRKHEIRRLARRKLMAEMKHEEEMEARQKRIAH